MEADLGADSDGALLRFARTAGARRDERGVGEGVRSQQAVPRRVQLASGCLDIAAIRVGDQAADDASQMVVVLSKKTNDKAFGGADSVGQTIRLDGHDYKVVGVLDEWAPTPKFYDLNNGAFDEIEELFVPFVAVAPYEDLDEAIRLANDTEYGLTAGFYSEDRAEIDRWLSSIEAGVVYVNRRAGATTGAWPGVQPFGGWKGSGTSGKAGGGPYYVQQYLREQSRTVIEE